jgi:ribokinase
VWDVVVVGGTNSDYVAHADRLPSPDESVDGDGFLESPGGKGANQAVGAARLGARVAFVTCVGGDARGRSLLHQLGAEGVDVSEALTRRHGETGAAIIHVDRRGRKQIIAPLGANRLLDADDVEAACARLGSAAVLMTQLEIPIEAAAAALRWGRRTGARTLLDPAPAAPLDDDLLSLVDVIKPNEHEAETLTGIRVTDFTTARDAAGRLLDRGVGAVAIAAGDDGNLLVWSDGEHRLPRLQLRPVDTTGAGDAFAAALAVWLARARPLIEASTFANVAAAFATTRLGAQPSLPRQAELHELAVRFGVGERA